MTATKASVSLISLFLLTSCWHGHHDHGAHEEAGHSHEHERASSAEGHEGHSHEGHDCAVEVVTTWGEHSQLFVEFRALVTGEESDFGAHLTRLSDHRAISNGTLTVELSGNEQPVEVFQVDHPAVAGIFRPIVRPEYAGLRRVRLRLDSSMVSEVHDLGEFNVFSSRDAANVSAGGEVNCAESITFLLEQQWRVPFRIEQVHARWMRPAFPAFAQLAVPPDAQAMVTAPSNGRVMGTGGRFPLLGEEVLEGDVLFRLTTVPQDGAEPATLELAVDQSRIRLDAARLEVERVSPLVESGVLPQRRLDEAASELALAEAELRNARRRRANLSQTQRVDGNRDSLAIPAPIDGTLAELLVAAGTWVSEGEPLARIVDRDRLLLTVGVPEAYVGRIRNVWGAWFRLENVASVIEVPRAALVSIGTEIDTVSRTLPVHFRVDNLRRDLFAGMTTLAHLVTDEPRLSLSIPNSALVDDAGIDVVYVQTGGESFERRPLRLGIRDGDHVEVIGGLAPGEWVVTRGAYSVKLAAASTESFGHGHAH